uniref:Guanine nucleotide exchange factor n=1 Tax=Entamoeba histolytica TaxID=5759 RepID=Q6WKY8_ENTHI|nr:guanine nucleotide exchange factor [Entamoeba histolytica]
MMDLFPDQKECDQVLMEVTSDDVAATCVEGLKFIDWKCIVGKLTVKQRNIIAAKIKEVSTAQRRQTEVLKMTGNVIKMNLFKPPKFAYSMDYRYWTVEQTSAFMIKTGVPKTAAYAVKDLDGIKLVNFDEKKLGWFEGFKIKGEILEKIHTAGTIAQKEFAATVITRAARQFEFRKMNKLYAYRTNVAQELLSTEESYVQQLNLIVKLFAEPVMTKQLITMDQYKKIFSDIQMILSVNEQFLQSFQKVISQWNSESKIGGLFIKLAPFLKIYGEYCKNYPEALKVLKELGSGHEFFKFYYSQIRNNAPDEYKNFELTSFLITPIQRIPRYKLLLNDLLKHTPQNHPDFKDLSNGFNIVSQVAISVNEFSRQHEYIDKVNELSERITDLPSDVNLQQPGRIYQKDGIVLALFKKKFVPCHCLLFSDVCIFAQYKEAMLSKTLSKKFTYKTHFNVIDMKIEEVKEEEMPKTKELTPETTLKITSGKSHIFVGLKSKADKDEWFKVFESAYEKAVERKKVFEDKAIEASKQKAEVAKNMLHIKYQSLRTTQTRKWLERGKSVAQMSCVEKWRLAQEAKQSMAEAAVHSRVNSSIDMTVSTPVCSKQHLSSESNISENLVQSVSIPSSPKPDSK